jgi:hypothetical protein
MDWGSLYALSIGGTSRTTDSIGAGSIDRELADWYTREIAFSMTFERHVT